LISSPTRQAAWGRIQAIATSASGIEVCELLPRTGPLDASLGNRAPACYHNGGCHKNLPMYTGYDVNLPDEEFRDGDPPSMGFGLCYLERDRQKELADLRLSSLSLGLG